MLADGLQGLPVASGPLGFDFAPVRGIAINAAAIAPVRAVLVVQLDNITLADAETAPATGAVVFATAAASIAAAAIAPATGSAAFVPAAIAVAAAHALATGSAQIAWGVSGGVVLGAAPLGASGQPSACAALAATATATSHATLAATADAIAISVVGLSPETAGQSLQVADAQLASTARAFASGSTAPALADATAAGGASNIARATLVFTTSANLTLAGGIPQKARVVATLDPVTIVARAIAPWVAHAAVATDALQLAATGQTQFLALSASLEFAPEIEATVAAHTALAIAAVRTGRVVAVLADAVSTVRYAPLLPIETTANSAAIVTDTDTAEITVRRVALGSVAITLRGVVLAFPRTPEDVAATRAASLRSANSTHTAIAACRVAVGELRTVADAARLAPIHVADDINVVSIETRIAAMRTDNPTVTTARVAVGACVAALQPARIGQAGPTVNVQAISERPTINSSRTVTPRFAISCVAA